MTNVDTTTPFSVGGQGAQVSPVKASSKKRAVARKVALTASKTAKSAKPKKIPTTKGQPRSKSAKVLELLARPKGATLADLMQATRWQAHSVRGFLSTASRKRGIRIESFKSDKSERVYRVKK
jgi:hypothetical protein